VLPATKQYINKERYFLVIIEERERERELNISSRGVNKREKRIRGNLK